MNFICGAAEMAFKWKCSENDNGNNTAAPCHECASAFFVLRHFPKHFFILFSHPESVVCKTPPALHIRAYSHSTSQPAESTWKQFSFNQVHYKGPSDANLSNTTILFLFLFFLSAVSLSNYIILISSWALRYTVLDRMRFLFIDFQNQYIGCTSLSPSFKCMHIFSL